MSSCRDQSWCVYVAHDRRERSSRRDLCERSSRAEFMVAVSRCSDLPDIHDDASMCIQYKGYKRTHDGDPPLALTHQNVKWSKRRTSDDAVSWGMYVRYRAADGTWKETHVMPRYFEDRSAFTNARVHPNVRGQCSRMRAPPPISPTVRRRPVTVHPIGPRGPRQVS